MKDFMSETEKEIRVSTLKSETGFTIDEIMGIDEHLEALEEAHYVHTINAFVELIVVYGYDKVIGDLRTVMGEKTW